MFLLYTFTVLHVGSKQFLVELDGDTQIGGILSYAGVGS